MTVSWIHDCFHFHPRFEYTARVDKSLNLALKFHFAMQLIVTGKFIYQGCPVVQCGHFCISAYRVSPGQVVDPTWRCPYSV